MKTILVIEDDPSISLGLQEALTTEHFSVKVANTGARGLSALKREHVNLVILDLRLPDMKGEDICRTIRADGSNLLILMLTAKTQEADKVLGLEIGADDYMTKPFSVRELTARIHALLRRQGDLSIGTEEVAFGDIEVDFRRRMLTKRKKEVRTCTVREFEVLKFLVEHKDQVVTRDILLNEAPIITYTPSIIHTFSDLQQEFDPFFDPQPLHLQLHEINLTQIPMQSGVGQRRQQRRKLKKFFFHREYPERQERNCTFLADIRHFLSMCRVSSRLRETQHLCHTASRSGSDYITATRKPSAPQSGISPAESVQ